MPVNWKHILTVATTVTLPAVIAALNGQPITKSTVWTALCAGAMATVALFIAPPVAVNKGDQK